MKREKILQLLLFIYIFSSFLSGCKVSNPNQILVPKRLETTITSENYTYNMTKAYHEAFTKGKKSFVLYFGSHRCQYCAEIEPLLLNYVQKTKIEIYYIDLYSQEYGDNREYYIETTNVMGAPNILIYKEGEMVHRERGASNLSTQLEVNKFFKEHVRTNNYYTTDRKDNIKPDFKKYVTFTYNFNNATHHELINTKFFPYFEKKGYVNYLVNEDTPLDTPTLSYGSSNKEISLPNDDTELETIISNYESYFS